MKRKKFMALAFTIICCMVSAGVLELKTAAASSAESVGDFSAVEDQVNWHSEDITYLNKELDALYSEIDNSVFDSDVEGIVLDSTGQRRNLLTSRGTIIYDNGKVVANAADLFTLTNKTDALENAYATAACRALNNIGTYFNADGDINYESQATEPVVLNCARIAEGILQSQSVEHLEATPVTEDNITAGAAAWVNGKCIIGNGADNERAYQNGIVDGAAGNREDVDIQYTYHAHAGNSGKDPIPDGDVYYSKNNPNGCYVAAGHTHNRTGTCGTREVEKTKECGCTVKYDEHVYDGSNCHTCGHSHYGWDGVYPDRCTATVTVTSTEHTCGSPTNTWKIGCNKKAGQIVSAEVTIRSRK